MLEAEIIAREIPPDDIDVFKKCSACAVCRTQRIINPNAGLCKALRTIAEKFRIRPVLLSRSKCHGKTEDHFFRLLKITHRDAAAIKATGRKNKLICII